MNKIYNPSESQKEGQEQSKKLYRSISEQVRRLDDARSCARTVGDLFTLSLEIQRSKFRDYCERLIFSDPVLYARKAEELLWRKGFYEVISTAKRLKKLEYSDEDKSNIQAHINIGIGYYHLFITRLQKEYGLDLVGVVDFPLLSTDQAFKHVESELHTAVCLSVHRSLTYLGDLCRYRLEIYPNWDPGLAVRYYNQALYFKPEYGMPLNQIGTLVSSLNMNYSLDAAYYYIRSFTCKYIFEGTENNLHRLFEKNSQFLEQLPVENPDADCIIQEPAEQIKRFVSRFLLLTDIWIFNKKVPHIYNLCHQTNLDLRECLAYGKPISSENGDTQTEDSLETDSSSNPSHLNSEIIYKIVIICLLSISKLQTSQSPQTSNVIAFTLAIYSQLIKNTTNHIQEAILNFPLPPEITNKTNGIKKKKNLRRRKIIKSNNSDESEGSDGETLDAEASSSDESILSDNEPICLSSEEEEELEEINENSEETKPKPTEEEETIGKSKCLQLTDMLEIFADENLLPSISIINDWLRNDVEVLKLCGKSTRSLVGQMVRLINLANVDIKKNVLSVTKIDADKLRDDLKKIPLLEDVTLKGVDILKNTQQDINWNYFNNRLFSAKEETLVRMLKLVSFGSFLTTIEEAGVVFDKEEDLFTVKEGDDEIESNNSPVGFEEQEIREMENGHTIKKAGEKKNETKGQLMKMKHMGQLWLAAEVKDLENRVRGKTSLSPYLVIDADSLMKFTSIVKQLVYSRKFIVLVPTAVVSVLDEMKKEKLEAREAIRWLEYQFQQGNRFFRAQRPQERLPIPLIKYPKKKDKESFIYIQIIECCHYLAQQQKDATNLVTLLMGTSIGVPNGENREISYVGLAQSAGVNLESITEFYAKWKKTAKGKR